MILKEQRGWWNLLWYYMKEQTGGLNLLWCCNYQMREVIVRYYRNREEGGLYAGTICRNGEEAGIHSGTAGTRG